MRNLKNVVFEEITIPSGLPLNATAWDTANDATICAFGPTPNEPFIELKRRPTWSSEYQVIASWDAPCPLPDLACEEIILLQYFADRCTACLVLAGGDVVVVREEPLPEQERIEIVGSVDAGISAAAWAPDEELLAIVTRTDTLVLMSRDFEPVTETTLTGEDLKASKHVSVGWGKKETQFQGKRAKAMRDPTIPETIDEGKPSSQEDGHISVSWRGDGAYFAVNSIVPDHRRVIRVFDREAILDSASEPVDGLEGALSWRPKGNLIASIRRSNSKAEVVFLERNGLRHGEFDLRLSQDDMNTWASRISLSWNIDSSVLAVGFRDRIQLWTMGNYHYYLKQEILFSTLPPSPAASLPALRWHHETPFRLHVLSSASLIDASFMFTVSRGPLIPPCDYGTVAVIDGKTLKLTPLKQAGLPPPMSFCEIPFDHNIVDCAFSPDGERIAVLTSQTVDICRWAMQQPPPVKDTDAVAKSVKRYSTEVTKRSIQLPSRDGDQWRQRWTQVKFLRHDEAFILAPPQRDMAAQLSCLILQEEFADTLINTLHVSILAQSLITSIQHDTIWSVDRKKTKMIGKVADDDVPDIAHSFEGGIPDSTIFRLAPENTVELNGYHESPFHRVSLTPKGILQVDDHVLARDCSSFAVTAAHIIFTTTQHLLKFVHLVEPAAMDVPGNTPEVDERCRSIEQGAKIVTVMPSAYAVVLQMPRGNLETIYPRVLVLSGIRGHIGNGDYRAAFLACLTHQVDLNILHDHQPGLFYANVSKFVDQLKKPARIDEFISKLKDEDVTQTLYRDTLATADAGASQVNGHSTGPSTPQPGSKVNRICDALISVVSSKPAAFLQNIITAHVCKRPPDLTSALTLVSTQRQTSTEEADLAISHLCFLTDTNRLYDAALALYDLEVTLLVAQNAQRDPREYMPFLQSLQSLPPLRRQYTIDNHLKNYPKALTSLHALSAHSEAEAYTIKHSLYPHALDLYKYSPSHLKTLTRHYASHLASQSQPLHAATLYESLSDYNAAYPLYALAHSWRESLTCASFVPLPTPQLHSLAHSLATTLIDESRDYRAAATIYAEYLSDIPTAARLLCRSSYFADAMRLLTLQSTHTALIPSIIDPALLDKFSEILSLISDCKSQLSSQVPRILELRRIKSQDSLAFFGGDPSSSLINPANDVPDNISLAPTDSTIANQSLFTRYGSSASRFGGTVASNVSRKTSKTKRKEERKRARGKKGSVYEEEYLVNSVSRLIERVNGTHDEVSRLGLGLRRRGMREQAEKIDETMRQMVGEMERAKEQVWLEKVEEGVIKGDGGEVLDREGEKRPRGADGVFWESQQQQIDGEVVGRKEAPEVKVWKGGEMFSG